MGSALCLGCGGDWNDSLSYNLENECSPLGSRDLYKLLPFGFSSAPSRPRFHTLEALRDRSCPNGRFRPSAMGSGLKMLRRMMGHSVHLRSETGGSAIATPAISSHSGAFFGKMLWNVSEYQLILQPESICKSTKGEDIRPDKVQRQKTENIKPCKPTKSDHEELGAAQVFGGPAASAHSRKVGKGLPWIWWGAERWALLHVFCPDCTLVCPVNRS